MVSSKQTNDGRERPGTYQDDQPEGYYNTKSDGEIWDAFRKGDEGAFIFMYNTYGNRLFNYGSQFTSDRESVKDCLQDFFIYLRKNRAGLHKTDNIKFYLYKAFKRRVLEFVRKSCRENEKKERFLFTQFPVELSFEMHYIHQQFQEAQLKSLNEALSALTEKEREAIYYFYYEGLSYEQIATIFEFRHVSSARRLVYKALAHLKKILLSAIIGFLIISKS
ncbi:RNA polymerase sigma factor [Negadavirga shengliensis]|uniref:RNA polymerase sigma factor n=1 Tax=Negadavirga shengliensis TaxID=1389218 RepID=A0ABV9T884_9BACT